MAGKDARRFKSNVRLDPWSHARVWLACGGALLVLRGLAEDSAWVEARFVDGFGVTIARWLAWLSSPFPLSVAEVLLVLLVAWVLLATLGGMAEVGAGRRQPLNALGGALLFTVDLAAVLLAWFYVSWGVAYARPPAAERFGLDMAFVDAHLAANDVGLLLDDTLRATERVNAAYLAMHKRDDVGVPTEPRAGLDVDAVIEQAYDRLGRDLGLPDSFRAPRGPAKVPFASVALSWLGIGGIYVPFTGEATVNGGPPAWSRVATVAHEKAHQRMVASEDEANFVGFLACVRSDEPLLRYAAWQFARRQLQRVALTMDPSVQDALQGKLGPGPQRDIVAIVDYWQGYEGWMQDAHETVNDTYLRLNHVEGGVTSYQRSALLLLAWLHGPEGRRLAGGGPPKAQP